MRKLHYYFLVVTLPLSAQSVTFNQAASREFGQPQLLQSIDSVAPNLVEGRELYLPGAVAFDTSVSPPILYIADTYNNRVLAFQNPDALTTCGISNPKCGFASAVVIGQRDLFSTLPQNPTNSSSLSAGLSLPTGLAVDSSGNLYVADSGNNRILRYPAPFKQTGVLLITDLVIGQLGVSTGSSANQGLQAPNAQSLFLSVNSVSGRINSTGLALDPSGNLWVTDPNNNRVLRFPANGGTISTTADRVLGQFDFVSRAQLQAPAGSPTGQLYPNGLVAPSGLAFDKSGGLYISDGYSRVLYYASPASGNGLAASRILGVNQQPTQANPVAPTYPNQFTLGAVNSNGTFVSPPLGVFTNGTNVFVADTGANRIAEYDIPANWPAATAALQSPPILAAVGQTSLTIGSVNKGQPQPDATTLAQPVAGAFLGTEMWVVDSGNNRVLGFVANGSSYSAATRLIGQLDFPYSAPNLIEGREVFFGGAGDVAVDVNSTPPHLYIADSQNNRVLGFNDARNVTQSSKADIVIGQPDLYHSTTNYPSGCDPTNSASPCLGSNPGNTGLNGPTALLVDPSGNLYVADTQNGRVVRFASPFASGASLQANLVLGQLSFGPPTQNPSQQNMGLPSGLAMNTDTTNTALYVADGAYNRVLVFIHAPGADFTNGQLASSVLGQPNFNSTTKAIASGSTPASSGGMNVPQHIATDTSDRLYVADSANNRVLVFTDAKFAANGAAAVLQITGLNGPQGVTVSPATGDIFVANSGANPPVVNRYPEFEQSQSNLHITGQIPLQTSPIAVTLDASGNPVVAENANRVSFYFPALAYQNSANYNSAPLAPGMLALLYRQGQDFNFTPTAGQAPTWPKVLSDVQVLVNGEAAPMFRLDPIDIAFMVPSDAPTSGNASFLVVHQSTGEIIGAFLVPMAPQNPGFYTSNSQGTGQVSAINYDQTTGSGCTPEPQCFVNSPSNPVAAGHIIEFYLTGQGVVPGAPQDGAAPTAATPTSIFPTIVTQAGILPSSAIGYSGLAPGLPGVWQVNITVPANLQGTGVNPITITMNDYASNVGPNNTPIHTTFSVK